MERHDDAEQHRSAREEKGGGGDYPRGRGYGQDYMRGGEVFGGYGYSERPEYARPLAERQAGAGAQADGEPGNDAPPEDERHDAMRTERMNEATGSMPARPAAGGLHDASAPPGTPHGPAQGVPPVPQMEGTFGTEGQRNYSRSYYVTQAQLQQRIYEPPEERETPGLPVDVEE